MQRNRIFFCFLLIFVLLCSLSVPVLADGQDVSSDPAASPLNGLKVLFVGDSICEARVEWDDPVHKDCVGWAGRIAVSDGIINTNISASGASVSDCRGANTVQAQLQKASGQKFDLVVLHGGVNDAWDGAPVGVMSDSTDMTTFDRSTFGGGLEFSFAYAKKAFQDAKFCFVINYQLPAAEKGVSLKDMSAYFDLAKQICDKWEIPYLDLYNNQEINDALEVSTSLTYLKDHIHPNSAGYDVIAPYIAEFLRTVIAPPAPVEESSEEPVSEQSEQVETLPGINKQSDGLTAFEITLIVVSVVAVAAFIALAAALLSKRKKEKEK
ncbi:MAG: SGNH/GDSL hydrolase family protein [Clostridiales bacterium]|nr:SGNH/GDSL hydrolase family protein [Candidatus Coliplasma caballi]